MNKEIMREFIFSIGVDIAKQVAECVRKEQLVLPASVLLCRAISESNFGTELMTKKANILFKVSSYISMCGDGYDKDTETFISFDKIAPQRMPNLLQAYESKHECIRNYIWYTSNSPKFALVLCLVSPLDQIKSISVDINKEPALYYYTQYHMYKKLRLDLFDKYVTKLVENNGIAKLDYDFDEIYSTLNVKTAVV